MAAEFPPEANRSNMIAFLEALFDRAGSLEGETLCFQIADVRFRLLCTDKSVFDFYVSRLVGSSSGPEAENRISVISAEDAGWPTVRWNDPEWYPDLLEDQLSKAGYRMDYPYFDRQWIVHSVARAHSIHFLPSMTSRLPWDGGAPLRLPLHWAFAERDRRLLHSGCLSNGRAGCLLSGHGGAGKSGTVLAGIANGLKTAGDDYVLLDQRVMPSVRGVYRIVKQDQAGLSRIPGLSQKFCGTPTNWQGKYELDPEDVAEGCFVPAIPLKAIVFPRIAHAARSSFTPLPRNTAVNRLVRSMLKELPTAPQASLLSFAKLTSRLPAFEMNLSSEPAEIADSISSFLESDTP
jgi:hypothetical protein